MRMSDHGLLKTRDVARELGKHVVTIRHACRHGPIAALWVSNSWRISPAEVERARRERLLVQGRKKKGETRELARDTSSVARILSTKPVFNASEVSTLLATHRSTIVRACCEGAMEGIKAGPVWVIAREEVEKVMRRGLPKVWREFPLRDLRLPPKPIARER